MEFSVTGKFKDCLTRQISEALRITNSADVLLNSKSEYGHNSVSRLVVQEDAWVRKERDRLEEAQAEMAKKQVDMFKQQKMEQIVAKAHKVNNEALLETQRNEHESLDVDNRHNQTVPEGWSDETRQENPSNRNILCIVWRNRLWPRHTR